VSSQIQSGKDWQMDTEGLEDHHDQLLRIMVDAEPLAKPSADSTYYTMFERERKRMPPHQDPPRNQKLSTYSLFTSTWFRAFIGMLLAITVTSGASWLYKTFIVPLYPKKQKKPKTLVITDNSPAQQPISPDIIPYEQRSHTPSDAYLIRDELSSLRNMLVNQATIQHTNELHSVKQEIYSLKNSMDRIQNQLELSRSDLRSNNSFASDNSILTDLRVEMANIKGMLSTMDRSSSFINDTSFTSEPRRTQTPVRHYEPQYEQVTPIRTRPELITPRAEPRIQFKPETKSKPEPKREEPREKEVKKEVEEPSHTRNIFHQPDDIQEIGDPISEVDELLEMSQNYNKTVIEPTTPVQKQPETPTQNIETVIVSPTTPSTAMVDHSEFDDMIFGGKEPSFDDIFNTAKQFSDSPLNPYSNELDFSNTDDSLASMEETVKSEPKFQKSKLFSFIDNIANGKGTPEKKKRTTKKKKKVENVFDNIYNENTSETIQSAEQTPIEKQSTEALEQVPVETIPKENPSTEEQVALVQPVDNIPSIIPFESYNFDADVEYQRKLDHVTKKGVLQDMDETKKNIVIEKLKGKHYKQTIDPSFNTSRFNVRVEEEEQAPPSPTAAEEKAPPYPTSFASVITRLSSGEDIPKKEINDMPKNLNQKPTPSVRAKKEKPWMKKKQQEKVEPVANTVEAVPEGEVKLE
jgi:hypothetical protein